ncbi:hypothetical protein AAFF_G00417340 [Aldrovandia affinis]|uniref:Uncharacterized protein n=1 Tax=Aldrovandia affinis TaxID=143900 RepID=A0AAD7VYB0_9TELE|nr:hypothetical protein AAFF_G00417340 [Aldrovandia affinis]
MAGTPGHGGRPPHPATAHGQARPSAGGPGPGSRTPSRRDSPRRRVTQFPVPRTLWDTRGWLRIRAGAGSPAPADGPERIAIAGHARHPARPPLTLLQTTSAGTPDDLPGRQPGVQGLCSPDKALFRPGVCTQPPPVPSPGSAVSPQAPDLSGYGVSGRTDPASADGAGRPAPEVLPCPLDPHPPPPPEQAQIPEPEQEQGAGKPQPPLYRARPAGLQPGL